MLSFLYGGLTCIPDELDVWDVVALALHMELEELVEVGGFRVVDWIGLNLFFAGCGFALEGA